MYSFDHHDSLQLFALGRHRLCKDNRCATFLYARPTVGIPGGAIDECLRLHDDRTSLRCEALLPSLTLVCTAVPFSDVEEKIARNDYCSCRVAPGRWLVDEGHTGYVLLERIDFHVRILLLIRSHLHGGIHPGSFLAFALVAPLQSGNSIQS